VRESAHLLPGEVPENVKVNWDEADQKPLIDCLSMADLFALNGTDFHRTRDI